MEQLLSDMPGWADPPLEEPASNDTQGSEELSPADPLWEAFYALPFVLQPDPLNEKPVLPV